MQDLTATYNEIKAVLDAGPTITQQQKIELLSKSNVQFLNESGQVSISLTTEIKNKEVA